MHLIEFLHDRRRNIAILLISLIAALLLGGCGGQRRNSSESSVSIADVPEQAANEIVTEDTSDLRMSIGQQEVAVDWEDNEAVDALRALVSNEALTIDLSMYGGFEQVGPIGTSLPREDEQVTTKTGDIVLYAGDQISVFYGSNTWDYTRLGHITEPDENALTELLSNGDTSLTLFLEGEEREEAADGITGITSLL